MIARWFSHVCRARSALPIKMEEVCVAPVTALPVSLYFAAHWVLSCTLHTDYNCQGATREQA